jgi:AraC family transcriptional regulator
MPETLSYHADAYHQRTRQPPHQHDALHLSLVLSGRVAESVGGATEYAGPLSVVAKDAGVTHANDFGGAGARLARLTLPDGSIGALVDDPARSPGWRWTHDPAVAAPFLRLVRRGQAGARAFASDDPDVVDLLAAFTARPAGAPRGRPPVWLSEAVDELRAGWHPGLTVRQVAARAGVHPVYLARCVRRWYGTGVGEELRRLRLRWTVGAVLGSRRPLAQVAHAAGFADEPHLCRAVREATGVTPGALRTLVGSLDYQWRGRG